MRGLNWEGLWHEWALLPALGLLETLMQEEYAGMSAPFPGLALPETHSTLT